MESADKKKKQKMSVAEKIMKVIEAKPKTAEEVKTELKDRFGYNETLDDIRINLLYLLRRERVRRERDDKTYKYRNI